MCFDSMRKCPIKKIIRRRKINMLTKDGKKCAKTNIAENAKQQQKKNSPRFNSEILNIKPNNYSSLSLTF